MPLDARGGVAPPETRYARHGAVCANDQLAATAGLAMLRAGGNAADAAVAAGAVMAVVSPNSNGLGGDLFAVVHESTEPPRALNASGRAGSGAAAAADSLRSDGHAIVPPDGDVRAVTVPGCVDGWIALHQRYGALPFATVLGPALDYAADGFPASKELAAMVGLIQTQPAAGDFLDADGRCRPGALIHRPGTARLLRALVDGGREAYVDLFAPELVEIGAGLFRADDVATTHADWSPALGVGVFGHTLWTVPPNSQGYLALAAAWIADGLDLPDDPDDPVWAHLLVESMRQAAYDRLDVLHDRADGHALLAPERLEPRRAAISADRAAALASPAPLAGATTYLCAADTGMAVSLIQSNAANWGSRLALPGLAVYLQNRGMGFSLVPGHPAAMQPGRRPPHTLSPAMITRPDGSLAGVLGLRGADAQPQIVMQLATRLLRVGQSPAAALRAPRWAVVSEADLGFDTWRDPGRTRLKVENHAPQAWLSGLADRGHDIVEIDAAGPGTIGHAHVIWRSDDDGVLAAASEPRATNASVAAW
jgi:gamma-glutamyltranspeptidase / glutathione hydrolase